MPNMNIEPNEEPEKLSAAMVATDAEKLQLINLMIWFDAVLT